MKNIVRTGMILAALAAMVLSACATVEEEPTSAPPQRRDLPQFFLSPPTPEDQFVGLGMAKLEDDNLSRTTALARARADIAAQVAVSVETMLTDYAQESGTDGNTQTLTFVERVSKEVADIELQGAVTKEQYPANDGTWYVMVFFPKAAMIEEVSNVFSRNEDAAFAEFKAQQALERLNAEVENNPPRSAGVDSPVNN
ncbi:MAG: LPP20 family lipoprotein [Spirochaetales bacterium]|nr:LPP20 family lipoprotein [Spirochaetales bacterium]